MSSSPSPSGAAPSNRARPETMRRRLRKGTHSCWECKRRKIRADHDIPTPMSMIGDPSRYLAFYTSSEVPSQDKYERLSRFLHQSLPSRRDTEKICTAARHPSVLAHEIMTMPYTNLDQNGLATPETLLEIPEPHIHPVLIARHMLLLASFLQQLHPELHKEIRGLSESPQAIRERLADLAANLVTTNDELLGSIEGLECVMIESVYQANIGNLRRSWISGRRAMSIAQLMGINRSHNQAQYKVLDPKTKYNPHHMWFRIVFLDRYLCLMLGVSQGCLDRSMASDVMLANDTPMGRLERIHCVIASRILERNESNYDIALTRTVDVELQIAARSLPSKWWLIPNLEMVSTDSQALFWNTRRLFAQVLHYNLLNQLHLPYMLCSLPPQSKYEYSRITCVNASREVLSRFITLRRFNGIACSCRTVDFLALMAAMTLLLAHLDSNLSDMENLLAHQYHSDRAMIEQVQENMKEVNRLNSDALSAQSADLLRRLLTIEVETAGCYPRRASRVSVQKAGAETVLPDQDDAVVSVHIPYFGIIKITHEGLSKEVPKPRASTAATNGPARSQVEDRSSTISPETLHAEPQMHFSTQARLSRVPNIEAMTPVNNGNGNIEAPSMMPDTYARTQAQVGTIPIPATDAIDVTTHLTLQPQNGLSDPLLQLGEYPGLVAGTEDWAFQGVDLAFFESLMRGTGNEENIGADWAMMGEVRMNNQT
ncbi:hypothetical protein OIDMADRAFT_102000 [Oidiodendron maius Zn]|uniref:Xylanolytic transcriptional activator regulatory domain-containing protein n=1 Tax=Oidiodendron maius (strain Zn) TaxID=913774 RepID=A0A0C3HB23_OIDMZ|nr:hypothetical protein OIDMADRAFT_102000 [Oidiodendron maius Zn]